MITIHQTKRKAPNDTITIASVTDGGHVFISQGDRIVALSVPEAIMIAGALVDHLLAAGKAEYYGEIAALYAQLESMIGKGDPGIVHDTTGDHVYTINDMTIVIEGSA